MRSSSTSDKAFALRLSKKAHDELLKLLDCPEVQKELTDEQRSELMSAERTLLGLRASFAEAVGHELAG